MINLSIPEMSCGHCKATIEKTIKAIDPAATLDFDMAARTVAIKSATPLDPMRAALKTAGYDAAAA